jgi:hypothetical protein
VQKCNGRVYFAREGMDQSGSGTAGRKLLKARRKDAPPPPSVEESVALALVQPTSLRPEQEAALRALSFCTSDDDRPLPMPTSYQKKAA